MAIAAPATNTVFHALADQLEPLAPRGIFGVMGEDTAALITDLCLRGVPFYRARHENHGVGMADGYALGQRGTRRSDRHTRPGPDERRQRLRERLRRAAARC